MTPHRAAECCATCDTPGVQTEAWLCAECNTPFTIGGEPVLSLKGLDAELDEGGIYCGNCYARQPPFEQLTCSGCSTPTRRIATSSRATGPRGELGKPARWARAAITGRCGLRRLSCLTWPRSSSTRRSRSFSREESDEEYAYP